MILKPLLKKAVAAFPRRNRVSETPSYVTAARLARRFAPPALAIDLRAEEITRQMPKPGFPPLRSVAA